MGKNTENNEYICHERSDGSLELNFIVLWKDWFFPVFSSLLYILIIGLRIIMSINKFDEDKVNIMTFCSFITVFMIINLIGMDFNISYLKDKISKTVKSHSKFTKIQFLNKNLQGIYNHSTFILMSIDLGLLITLAQMDLRLFNSLTAAKSTAYTDAAKIAAVILLTIYCMIKNILQMLMLKNKIVMKEIFDKKELNVTMPDGSSKVYHL